MDSESRPQMIFYRDVEMSPDWPEAIRRAQSVLHYTIDGRQYRRVRYGRERPSCHADQRACHDCAVLEGELHVPGCDMEQCPACRGQAISCGCNIKQLQEESASE